MGTRATRGTPCYALTSREHETSFQHVEHHFDYVCATTIGAKCKTRCPSRSRMRGHLVTGIKNRSYISSSLQVFSSGQRNRSNGENSFYWMLLSARSLSHLRITALLNQFPYSRDNVVRGREGEGSDRGKLGDTRARRKLKRTVISYPSARTYFEIRLAFYLASLLPAPPSFSLALVPDKFHRFDVSFYIFPPPPRSPRSILSLSGYTLSDATFFEFSQSWKLGTERFPKRKGATTRAHPRERLSHEGKGTNRNSGCSRSGTGNII